MLIIACGAIAKEILEIKERNRWNHIKLQCIPADLHNHPHKIPDSVRAHLEKARSLNEEVFVAYGDCGTGGLLDAVLQEYNVERLPGAHCYEFFAGGPIFEGFVQEELGTYYLTDFLVRHFERLVWKGMGLDKHPELLPVYFAHYKKVVYLAQTRAPELEVKARECADRLGLTYQYHFTGLNPVETHLNSAVETVKWQN